jgi:hypothetical protein
VPDNLTVGDLPSGKRFPEVGTLSPDGSRTWDGRFWVLIRNDSRLDELPPLPVRRQAAEFSPERRSYRLGRVVLAASVGLTLSFIPIPAPSPGSLDSALTELVLVTLLRVLFAFAAVVVILSLGRQGIDVLLLRAMLTAFLMGAAVTWFLFGAVFLAAIPLPVTPRIPWPFVVMLGGLLVAVLLGPFVAVVAALANLLWYRSLRSLKAQLGIVSRLVLAAALATNIGFSLWDSVYGHNFSSWVLGGGPAAAMLFAVFLLRKSSAAKLAT